MQGEMTHALHHHTGCHCLLSACRYCPQGPEEHSESTLLHIWQVQVTFPTAATPTNHAHKPRKHFSRVTIVMFFKHVLVFQTHKILLL